MRTPAVRRTAHSQWNSTRHAVHARAAATRLGILSQGAISCRCFAHFLHQNAILCALSVQNRPRTDRDRILLRESTPISCHENKGKFFKTRPIRPKSNISIPYRYPVDTRFPKNTQLVCVTIGRFSANSVQNRPPLLRTCAALPNRRLISTLTSTLILARVGVVARDEALCSPVKPDAAILATVESVAKNPRSAADESNRPVLLP